MLTEIIRFFLSPIFTLVDPYFARFTDAITSQQTQRFAVKSIFIGVVSISLVSVAVFSYLGFYWIYVPEISHVQQIHLQYHKDMSPRSLVKFGQSLTAGQVYDVSVDIYVPTTPRNNDMGNFMVGVELKDANNNTVKEDWRPCRLTYKSPILRHFTTVLFLIPYTFRYGDEAQLLQIKVLEDFNEDSSKRVTHAYVTISDQLETYYSRIRLDARFRGLRYLMYYHPLSTGFTFISLFLCWELLFSFLAWQSFVSRWKTPAPITPKTGKQMNTSGVDERNQTGAAEDEGWETVRREDGRGRIIHQDGNMSTDADSEVEGSQIGSIISNLTESRNNSGSQQYSESGENSYTTESYVTDDDQKSATSRRTRDDSVITQNETEDEILEGEGQTEGTVTPRTQSRRTSASGVSVNTSDDDYEAEERTPAATSTSRSHASASQPHLRRVGGSGVGRGDNDTNPGNSSRH